MLKKLCKGTCKTEKDIHEFRSHITKGKRYYRGECRDCENEVTRHKRQTDSRSCLVKSYLIIPNFTYEAVWAKLDHAIRNQITNPYSLRGAFNFFINKGSASRLSHDEKMTIIKAWENIRLTSNKHLWIWSKPDKAAILVRGTTDYTDAVKSMAKNTTIYREWSAINDVLEWSKKRTLGKKKPDEPTNEQRD